jgi:hypothetical protein
MRFKAILLRHLVNPFNLVKTLREEGEQTGILNYQGREEVPGRGNSRVARHRHSDATDRYAAVGGP